MGNKTKEYETQMREITFTISSFPDFKTVESLFLNQDIAFTKT
jgi:hypothetical protein